LRENPSTVFSTWTLRHRTNFAAAGPPSDFLPFYPPAFCYRKEPPSGDGVTMMYETSVSWSAYREGSVGCYAPMSILPTVKRRFAFSSFARPVTSSFRHLEIFFAVLFSFQHEFYLAEMIREPFSPFFLNPFRRSKAMLYMSLSSTPPIDNGPPSPLDLSEFFTTFPNSRPPCPLPFPGGNWSFVLMGAPLIASFLNSKEESFFEAIKRSFSPRPLFR